MAEPRNRYSTVSVVLHWLIALMILSQVLLITAHEATEGQAISREFVQIHKAAGLTVLILTLARIGWRLANPEDAKGAMAGLLSGGGARVEGEAEWLAGVPEGDGLRIFPGRVGAGPSGDLVAATWTPHRPRSRVASCPRAPLGR